MHIKNNRETVDTLLDELRGEFEHKPFTEGTITAMQDKIEHALVTYTKEDIDSRAFLNPHVVEQSFEKRLQLFITDTIYVDVPFRTHLQMGFQQIETIQDVRILQTDSLS